MADATLARYDQAALMPLVLERLKQGESVRQIAKSDGMPDEALIREWGHLPLWAPQYAQAREAGYLKMGDELVEIADDSRNDWMDRETRDGRIERVVDREAIERTRMRLDTRKWMLSKMLPKVYGDKLALDVQSTSLVAFVDMTRRAGEGSMPAIPALPYAPAPSSAYEDDAASE